LEGRFGKAFVFAEVSSDMPSGEFVYGKALFVKTVFLLSCLEGLSRSSYPSSSISTSIGPGQGEWTSYHGG
jgi:hypothetical protein